MRIISKFSDYYDSGLAYGQDDSLVYARETSEITFDDNRAEFIEAQKLTEVRGRRISVKDKFHPSQREYEPACVYFCGKMYPFYRIEIEGPKREDGLFGGFPTRVNVHSFNKEFSKYIVEQSRYWWDKDKVKYDTWITEDIGKPSIDINLHFNSPIVIYFSGRDSYSAGNRYVGGKFIINPCLKDFEFQRQIDPYATFQEIAMFLGGVLTNNPTPPDTQSDKEKISGHGFDPKYGFRKTPEEK